LAFGQQPAKNTTAPTPAPQPVFPARDYVDFTGFKGKVFELKNRSPQSLQGVLMSLTSGFKGAEMRFSDELGTITVRDFPENIAAIEEAIKRFDIAQPPQPDIELRMHVMIASNLDGVTSQYPSDLGDVVKQLQATLNYKSYTNIATVMQRVKAGSRNIGLNGTAEIPSKILENVNQPMTCSYDYRAHTLNLIPETSSAYSVQLGEQEFTFNGPGVIGSARIRTELNLRSGEKVVVGTTTLGSRGLILVLSARVMK